MLPYIDVHFGFISFRKLIRYVIVSSSNFYVLYLFLTWSDVFSDESKTSINVHYIYLFTLEIHCIIRVKHVLTHHSSTANSAAELTVQNSHTTAGCCTIVAATWLIPMHS